MVLNKIPSFQEVKDWVNANTATSVDGEIGDVVLDYTSAVLTSPTDTTEPPVGDVGDVWFDFSSGLISGPTEDWKFSTNASVDSHPKYHNGNVIFGTHNGVLRSYDTATGSQNWNYDIGSNLLGYIAVGDGIVATGDYNGDLYAVNESDGSLAWSTSGQPFYRVLRKISFYGGKFYVGNYNGGVYVYDATTGNLDDTFRTSVGVDNPLRVEVTEDSIYSADTNKVVFSLDRTTGAVNWEYQRPTYYGRDLLLGGDTVYDTNEQGELKAINATDGTLKYTISNFGQNLSYENGILVGCDQETINAIDTTVSGTPPILWSYTASADNGQTYYRFNDEPEVKNGVVYAGNSNWNFYAIDAYSGELIWKFSTNDDGRKVTSNGDYMYGGTLSGDGSLYAIKSEIGKFHNGPSVSDGAEWVSQK